MFKSLRSARGQAAVELLAALPVAAVVMFAGWQLVVTGHAWWKLHEAARLAARARYVAEQRGAPGAGEREARKTLAALTGSSSPQTRRLRVGPDGAVTVSARVPLVGPFRLALGAAGGPRMTSTSRMSP